jgi:hypothetical protein
MRIFIIYERSPDSSSKDVQARILSTMLDFMYCMHYLPPWPSNTAKKLMSFHSLPPTSSSIIRPSYMESLKPESSICPALYLHISNDKLPIFSWLWRLNGTCLPYLILLKTLPWGMSLPRDTCPTGVLPVRMSSGLSEM